VRRNSNIYKKTANSKNATINKNNIKQTNMIILIRRRSIIIRIGRISRIVRGIIGRMRRRTTIIMRRRRRILILRRIRIRIITKRRRRRRTIRRIIIIIIRRRTY